MTYQTTLEQLNALCEQIRKDQHCGDDVHEAAGSMIDAVTSELKKIAEGE